MIPKFDINKINLAIKNIKNIITESVSYFNIQGVSYVYWPLFMAKEIESRTGEIDTSATTLGLLVLLKCNNGQINANTESLLEKALDTVLWLRNPDGSWPSVTPIHSNNPPKMEGVINDTVYALTALVESGFLDDKPQITVANLKARGQDIGDLDKLEDRITLIMKSVEWLLNNRVNDGWHYTGIDYIEKSKSISAAVLPTAYTVVLLDRLIKTIKKSCPNKLDYKFESAYKESIEWLLSVQGDTGGFGKKRGDIPHLVHTSIAINALVTSDTKEAKIATDKAFRWILKNKQSYMISSIKNNEFFDHYNQIIFSGDKIFKRVINNEVFLEGIMLEILVKVTGDRELLSGTISFREKYLVRKIIWHLYNSLLDRQVKDGELQGAIKSRRGIPNEQYPVYCLYHSLLGLCELKEGLERVNLLPSFITIISRNSLLLFGLALLVVTCMIIQNVSWENASFVVLGAFIINIISALIQK